MFHINYRRIVLPHRHLKALPMCTPIRLRRWASTLVYQTGRLPHRHQDPPLIWYAPVADSKMCNVMLTLHKPDSQTPSSTSALSPQASPPAFGHASPTVASSPVLKEEGPKKRLLAIAICPFPHCSRMFRRLQELERHILRHLPRWICCTQPGCSWNGYRLDLLRSHLRREHQDAPFLEHGSEGIKIYDAKRLVKQLLKKNITVEQAECEAHAASQKGDVELGIRHA